MPLPAAVYPGQDPCILADRWGLDPVLAQKLIAGSSRIEFGFSVISGSRTARQQDALRRSGRPTAANDTSTHLACPATGVDLRASIAVTDWVKARLGAELTLQGLRWGGGSPPDPETGIPSDWNHFDLGPRR